MARLKLLPSETLDEAAECLRMMAHPARLRIVEILMQAEYPVGEIARLCELSPHQACEHLRMMKRQGLLGSVRRGRSVYYNVASPRLPSLINCIRNTCSTSRE